MRRIAFALLAIAPLAAPESALALGRPGLWNIVTISSMPNMPDLPPQAMEMMKKRGLPGPGQPITSQICMTPEQAKMTVPPRMDATGMNCTSRLISQTATSVTSEAICTGRMEGRGRSTVNWRGDTHYDGNYSFTGTMGGRPQQVSSKFTGDFVKADCGAVKPFDMNSLKALNRPVPPPPR